MAFTNETTHYGLPQWIGSDKPTYLVDQNNAFQKIDSEIYNANVAAGQAVTTAEGAVNTAGSAASSAAEALSTAQTASSTADDALAEAQTANTNAQSAQTAAGAAQTAAEAAQTAAAGNSITNLAPAYDPTITYNIGDLVTAEGKLYKCIVSIVTPEQFDINKWDDVTTSEVYVKSGQIYHTIKEFNKSATVPVDTTVTKATFLQTALPQAFGAIKAALSTGDLAIPTRITFDNTVFIESTSIVIYPNSDVSNIGFESSLVYNIAGTGVVLKTLNYLNNTATLTNAIIATDNTVTYNDESSGTNDTALTITYDIYHMD